MHVRAFDKAVKRYRQRVQHVKPVSKSKGRRFHLWGHHDTPHLADPPLQDKARSASRSSSVFSLSPTHAAPENDNTSVPDSHTRAQEHLEALPSDVLRHAKTFHTYIRLFVDDGNILDTKMGGSSKAMTSGGMAEVSGTLRKLLDEISVLSGGSIGKAAKEEVLQDPHARHVSTVFAFSGFRSSCSRFVDSVRVEH
jgi:potassium channel subfamily K